MKLFPPLGFNPSTLVDDNGDNEKLSKLDQLANDLGLQTIAGREALHLALENVLLLDRKQQDYGSANISSFGAFGCVVRITDKVERLKHLYGKKHRKAVNESVLDSFRDLSNYAIIAHLVETGKWPKD